MKLLEKNLTNILYDLTENHNITGLKTEFALEASTYDDAKKLKELANHLKLELSVKIGGCEAVKDINDTKRLNVNTIVAPMIESPYAAKKYIQSIKSVYSEIESNKINIFVNLETIFGVNCAEEILNSEVSKYITGIVFGRTDMAHSLGKNCDFVDDIEIFNYAKKLSDLCQKYDKQFIVGGGISNKSIDFLRNLKSLYLNQFETRKVVFDAKALTDKNITLGIQKAIEFELLWIKEKEILTKEDTNRIKILESRLYT